jgi:hypothetical protein
MKKNHIKTLILILLCISSNAYSQHRPNNKLVAVHQLDPRFTFSIEKYWSGIADAEEYFYYVKNNTADTYQIEIEVTLTLNCYSTNPYRLGINKVVYLKPYGEFTPKDDWAHIYMISSDKEKQKNCLIKEGNTNTLYRNHVWQILKIENLTQKKANEEKKKKDDELALVKKRDDDKKKKEDELALNKKNETEKKEKELQKKSTTANSANEESKTSESKTSESNKKIAEKKVTNDNLEAERKKKEVEEENERNRIAAERKAAEEEIARKQQQQSEYDSWKASAIKEREQQDALAIGTTVSFMTILGGFIYEGMGETDPYLVYQAPSKKFTPLFFMNNNFGFSFSTDPILFQSNYSTMKNGTSTNTKSTIGEIGYFLNLGAESKIGVGNDYYSLYGLLYGKMGIVPTFSGFQYSLGFGGGADLGIKNVKLFGQYRINAFDNKTLSLSDVEENGDGEYDMPSTEFTYGVKFTFGGDKDSDYKRQHISIGMINKNYNFDGDSFNSHYYDPELKSLKKLGSPVINGYSLEWRKDLDMLTLPA